MEWAHPEIEHRRPLGLTSLLEDLEEVVVLPVDVAEDVDDGVLGEPDLDEDGLVAEGQLRALEYAVDVLAGQQLLLIRGKEGLGIIKGVARLVRLVGPRTRTHLLQAPHKIAIFTTTYDLPGRRKA